MALDTTHDNSRVKAGWLKGNIERIAKERGVVAVIWNKSIPTCVDWYIKNPYTIPSNKPSAEDSPHKMKMEIFSFVLKPYGLIPKYHSANKVLEILTTQKYKVCPDEV